MPVLIREKGRYTYKSKFKSSKNTLQKVQKIRNKFFISEKPNTLFKSLELQDFFCIRHLYIL